MRYVRAKINRFKSIINMQNLRIPWANRVGMRGPPPAPPDRMGADLAECTSGRLRRDGENSSLGPGPFGQDGVDERLDHVAKLFGDGMAYRPGILEIGHHELPQIDGFAEA